MKIIFFSKYSFESKLLVSSFVKSRWVIILSFILILTSCEKVIHVEFNESAEKYVVEGMISNLNTEPIEVRISKTKKFEEDNSFSGISGEVVAISVNGTTTYQLVETSRGVYQTRSFIGIPGNSYTLNVAIGGNQLFTSTSVMPAQLVSLDSISVDDLAFGGESTKTIQPSYLDPVGLGNSYRFIQTANGKLVKAVFVQNDALGDGLRVTRPLVNRDGKLKSGDIVKVDMLCIDENVYKYWYSLDQASTGQSQATPANPVSNISGGALGYFSAHSISTKTIVIP